MWQKIKDVLKDVKSYVGLVVGLFGAANNYLHVFMPLAPDMRLRASVFVILVPAIAVGITIAKVHDRTRPGLRRWAGTLAGMWAAAGFVAWAAYAPLVGYLESHSSNPSVSAWFDALQIGTYVLPFICWSVALSALLALFL